MSNVLKERAHGALQALKSFASVFQAEKTKYIKYEEALCVHVRSGKPGCTLCLDTCPTGAITSAGNVVQIDAGVCAGCGGCAAVCPTGAAKYEPTFAS